MKTVVFGSLVAMLAAMSVGCQKNLVNGGLFGECASCQPVSVHGDGLPQQPQPEVQQVGHFRRVGGLTDAPGGKFAHGGHAHSRETGCVGCGGHGGPFHAGAGPMGGGHFGAGHPGLPTRVAQLPPGYQQYLSSPAAGGPPGPTYGYPYYTTRGPRDFLLDNPPSIGY